MRKVGIMCAVILAVLLFSGACVSSPAVTPSPTPEPEPTQEPPQFQRTVIISDSLVLEGIKTYSDVPDPECFDLSAVEYPFNRWGYYLSEPFFVMDDEVFELVVTADCPVGLANGIVVDCVSSPVGGWFGWDCPEPVPTPEPTEERPPRVQDYTLKFDLHESGEIERSGTRFTRTYVVKSDWETGERWYHIEMHNLGSVVSQCEYVMSLMK